MAQPATSQRAGLLSISPSRTASFSATRSVARIRSSDAAANGLPYRFRHPANAVNMRRTSRKDSSDSLIRPSAGTRCSRT
ncbi:hypothetical protein Aph01nite_28840 [Acrocarpospora phusangensis]|uniref:Uncharacterized protein n=1 Tax=Acrocarpospora phusangensis TaxID=1070424 RepID=A0A919UK08_9ACTN|nr:hypothetical protein Aph01nite_28840 [Acrocarpospora phusangensis]